MTTAGASQIHESLCPDPNLQIAMEGIPSALIGWEMDDFYRGAYNASFLAYSIKNRQTVEALQCFCEKNRTHALAAQRKCCTILLNAVEKELPKVGQLFRGQARAVQLDHYRMAIVSYFNPLIFALDLQISQTLPDILREEWLTRYPKYPYQIVTREMVAAGFERSWSQALRKFHQKAWLGERRLG